MTPRDLQVTDDGVFLVGEGGRTRLSALYRRIDELELMDSAGADLRPIGRALGNAVRRGNVALLNGFGNGVADDKLTYAYVPEMIAYYLDEKPILDNVPTYPCVDSERRAEVLDRLDELVLKPVNGYGGKGIVIGPHAVAAGARRGRGGDPRRAGACGWRRTWCRCRRTRRSRAATSSRAPSTCGCSCCSRGAAPAPTSTCCPAALSRVAPADSLIVNSSRGGGAKDTWVLKQ